MAAGLEADGAEVPYTFIATARNTYAWPFFSPEIRHGPCPPPSTVQTAPPRVAMTRMRLPGVGHGRTVTSAHASPALTAVIVGWGGALIIGQISNCSRGWPSAALGRRSFSHRCSRLAGREMLPSRALSAGDRATKEDLGGSQRPRA